MELRQVDQKIRKLLTMHMAFHLINDNDRLQMFRKDGGRRLLSFEDYEDASIQGFREDLKKVKKD